jgi:hypothetical protein
MAGLMESWAYEFSKLARFQRSGNVKEKETEKLSNGKKKQEEAQENKRRLSRSLSEITICMLMDRFAPN